MTEENKYVSDLAKKVKNRTLKKILKSIAENQPDTNSGYMDYNAREEFFANDYPAMVKEHAEMLDKIIEKNK